MRRTSRIKNGGSEKVDLGLSSILNGLEDKPLRSDSSSLLPPAAEPERPTAAPAPGNDYRRLAEEGKWAELGRYAEQRLSSLTPQSAAHCEANLWWVKAQLVSGSVPVSILSAPLSAAVRSLESLAPEGDSHNNELRVMAKSLLQEAAAKLEENGDTVPAQSLRQQAQGLAGTAALAGAAPRAATAEAPVERPAHPSAARRPSRRFVAALSAFTVVAAVMLGVIRFLPRAGEPGDIASEPMAALSRQAPPMAPLEVAGSQFIGRLDSLLYKIEDSPEKQAQIPSGSPPVPAVQAGRKKLDTIDTTGPIERAEVRRRIQSARSRPQRERRQNIAASDRNSGNPSEILGPDAIGRPRGERYYRVIHAAAVRTHPSDLAAQLDELKPGERVLVSGDIGQWLMIRSIRGRTAYIRARTVRELPEWEQARVARRQGGSKHD